MEYEQKIFTLFHTRKIIIQLDLHTRKKNLRSWKQNDSFHLTCFSWTCLSVSQRKTRKCFSCVFKRKIILTKLFFFFYHSLKYRQIMFTLFHQRKKNLKEFEFERKIILKFWRKLFSWIFFFKTRKMSLKKYKLMVFFMLNRGKTKQKKKT